MTGRLEGISGNNFSPLVMVWPLLLSVLGVAFCAWNALGNNVDICVSAGCELSDSMTLGGVSLWWYGAVGFCILVVASLSGRPWLGVAAAGLCVILDIFLLALMLTTVPCLSCLVVGLVFVLVYVAFRHAGKGLDPIPRSILVLVWLAFFIANVGVIVQTLPSSWAIYGAKDPKISVYFSPSCPACRTAVTALSSNKDVAFYPVMEKKEDFDSITSMLSNIQKGDNIVTALEKADKDKNNGLGFFENIYVHFYLMRNQSKVLMSGSSVIPFIEYHGLPKALVPAPPKPVPPPPPPVPTPAPVVVPPVVDVEPMETIESMDPLNIQPSVQGMDADLPIDTGIAGSCGGEEQEPCPDTVP